MCSRRDATVSCHHFEAVRKDAAIMTDDASAYGDRFADVYDVYELGVETDAQLRIAAAFDELGRAI